MAFVLTESQFGPRGCTVTSPASRPLRQMRSPRSFPISIADVPNASFGHASTVKCRFGWNERFLDYESNFDWQLCEPVHVVVRSHLQQYPALATSPGLKDPPSIAANQIHHEAMQAYTAISCAPPAGNHTPVTRKSFDVKATKCWILLDRGVLISHF